MFYIPGFKEIYSAGLGDCHFQIRGFDIQHVVPVGKMLSKLAEAFYESDFKAEFKVNNMDEIIFILTTSSHEIAEYVNRLYVPAQ